MENKINEAPIGVIGLGDLGKKLATQLLLSNKTVKVFDVVGIQIHDIELEEAVDPQLERVNPQGHLNVSDDISELLQDCRIVHWAVPSDKLESLPALREDVYVVLHDSVMNNSTAAISERADMNRFVISHCLMNEDRRVIVSPEYGENIMIVEHFKEIGLAPKFMRVKNHDDMMARTQGIFALLISIGIGKTLDEHFRDGDLTPSAIELREAVKHRESKWTKATIHSILNNPELKTFINEILDEFLEIENI